jgi:hypothetical protein
MRFAWNGEGVELSARPSELRPTEPIRYLEPIFHVLPVGAVEHALSDFVSLVIRRLNAVGLLETEVHALWAEVQSERQDSVLARMRRFEAQLGYDPDEAPPDILEALAEFERDAGANATAELASACALSSNRAAALTRILELGAEGTPGTVHRIADHRLDASAPPWERGWQLASRVRQALALHGARVQTTALSDLLGISPEFIERDNARTAPAGVLVRRGGDEIRQALGRKHRLARRFEAARLFAEDLLSPTSERWLVASDAKTARQKVQRAFAAEFLAPFDALMERLRGDFTDDSVEEVAAEFDVSPRVVVSQLSNHDVISADAVF